MTNPAAAPSNRFLLELGCEELPADFLKQTLESFPSELQTSLAKRGLTVASDQIAVEGTPRRLLIALQQLPLALADQQEVLKGPPASIAWDAEGNLSKAGEGFLKKSGASAEQCLRKALEINGPEYLVVERTQPGANLGTELGNWVVEAIRGIQGKRFMRWGSNEQTFSRPVRWLMAFWNDTPLEVVWSLGIDTLKAEPYTYGHRVLSQGKIAIAGQDDYWRKIRKEGYVEPVWKDRYKQIENALQSKAHELGCVCDENQAVLIEELCALVEWPTVLVGQFEERYLKLPASVLTTVMRTHQRYMPLWKNGQLHNAFLIVANNTPHESDTSSASIIISGNERVIRARFEDAVFFYDEDIKTPLIERLESLKGLTFQKGLGTLYDKAQRLKALAVLLNDYVNFSEQSSLELLSNEELEKAALLAKCDLVTQMVFELTELQGEVGAHYARQQGESDTVADAIYEHYLPRFAGDRLPKTVAGRILSLADKLDTLVAVFSQKDAKLPTGSKDPLGLRRAMRGWLLIARYSSLQMESFHNLAQQSYLLLKQQDLAQSDWENTWSNLQDFAMQRLKVLLREPFFEEQAEKQSNFDADVIEVVFATEADPLNHLNGLWSKLERVQNLKYLPDELLIRYVEPANRIDRILGANAISQPSLDQLDKTKLGTVEEQELLEAVQQVSALFFAMGSSPESKEPDPTSRMLQNVDEAGRRAEAFEQGMLGLYEPITRFFDSVLVNDPDAEIRQARITLLSVIQGLYFKHYGKLSLLVVPQAHNPQETFATSAASQ